MLPNWRNAETLYLSQILKHHPEITVAPLSHGAVHYSLQGAENAPVVVLVHGFSVPSFAWESNQSALVSQGFRVLSFDLYGRGFSARPNTNYDLTLFVEQLRELIEFLDLKTPIHLVGLSMGAVVVAAFATSYPDKTQSVSLLAPLHFPVKVGPLTIPVLGRYLAYVFYVPNLIKTQIQDFVKPAQLAHWQERYAQQMQIKGFRNALFRTATQALQEDPKNAFLGLKQQAIPTLVIWGVEDTLCAFEGSDQLRNWLPADHQFIPLENTGHAVQYQSSDKVNQALIEFMKQHP